MPDQVVCVIPTDGFGSTICDRLVTVLLDETRNAVRVLEADSVSQCKLVLEKSLVTFVVGEEPTVSVVSRFTADYARLTVVLCPNMVAPGRGRVARIATLGDPVVTGCEVIGAIGRIAAGVGVGCITCKMLDAALGGTRNGLAVHAGTAQAALDAIVTSESWDKAGTWFAEIALNDSQTLVAVDDFFELASDAAGEDAQWVWTWSMGHAAGMTLAWTRY